MDRNKKSQKIKILSVTGIRSDYALLHPVYKAIKNHPKLKLSIVVTGAHLSPEFGYTIKEIKSDGFKVLDEIESLISADSDSARIKTASIQLAGIIQSVKKLKPDILLILGDREEAVITALVGAYMSIPVAHISGGDASYGNVDDTIRHAVTKLSHIHFVTNEESEKNILRLGEQPSRIFNVGNPGLDRISEVPKISRKKLSQRINFDVTEGPIVCVIQHPLSVEIEKSYKQMKITLEAIRELGYKAITIYPNSDAGAKQIIKAIEEYGKLNPSMRVYKNVPRFEFVNILRITDCLVGNSSSGILEAPFLRIPVVNIGRRQEGRLCAENVAFVNHDKDEIINSIKKSCLDKEYINIVKKCSSPYGDGHASEKIVDILANIEINEDLIIKKLSHNKC